MTDTASDKFLNVNGTAHEAPSATEPLVEVLGVRLGLHSVRETCGIGVCGSCTVLLDDEPVSSCLLLTGQVRDNEIVTAEGLEEHGGRGLQDAFLAYDAFQCSFCIPAITVTAHGILQKHPDADVETLKEHLSGNLCRCGSYPRILEAVLAAAGAGRSLECSGEDEPTHTADGLDESGR